MKFLALFLAGSQACMKLDFASDAACLLADTPCFAKNTNAPTSCTGSDDGSTAACLKATITSTPCVTADAGLCWDAAAASNAGAACTAAAAAGKGCWSDAKFTVVCAADSAACTDDAGVTCTAAAKGCWSDGPTNKVACTADDKACTDDAGATCTAAAGDDDEEDAGCGADGCEDPEICAVLTVESTDKEHDDYDEALAKEVEALKVEKCSTVEDCEKAQKDLTADNDKKETPYTMALACGATKLAAGLAALALAAGM